MSRLKKLKHIECELRKDWLEVLAELPSLRWLELTLPKNDKIPALKPLSQIRTLVLRCNRHQTRLSFLRGLKSVRSLCVSEAIGVTQLNAIGSLVGLQELYIDGMVRGIGKVKTLAPFAKLADLRFAVLLVRCQVANRPLRPLLSLKKLGFLHLASQYLKDKEQLQCLVDKLPRLKCVSFNGGLKFP